MNGILAQLNTSPGGLPKTPILFAHVSHDGVAGDWQRNRKYHGGPNRAVCLFSEELYAALRAEGLNLVNGSVGENLTTRGVDLQALSKGDRLSIGEHCVVEITDVRVPCRTLKQWAADLPKRIEGRSGWLAKVVTEGTVRPGDPVVVLKRHRSTRNATSARPKASAELPAA